MKRFGILIASAVAIAALSIQAAEPKGEINKRRENQQDRIAQGVKSGELTPAETARLEKKEAMINREIRHDRRKNGGNLTNKQKARINRQQNAVSKEIYKQKHDDQTQPK
jgi:hypothetical protein